MATSPHDYDALTDLMVQLRALLAEVETWLRGEPELRAALRLIRDEEGGNDG